MLLQYEYQKRKLSLSVIAHYRMIYIELLDNDYDIWMCSWQLVKVEQIWITYTVAANYPACLST